MSYGKSVILERTILLIFRRFPGLKCGGETNSLPAKKNRRDFVLEMKAHPWVRVVIGIWVLMGIGSTVLTYSSPSWQHKAYVGQYIPQMSLRTLAWWLVGLLAFAVFVLFESAFQAYAYAHSAIIVPAAQPSTVSAVSTGGAGGNASIGDIHIHPVPLIRPAVPLARPRERVPNIQCINVRKINLHVGATEWGSPIFHEMGSERPEKALVATFRNAEEFGKDFCDAEYVSAHIRLKDANNNEIGTGISRAAWLTHYNDLITIGVAESESVVLWISDRHGDAMIPCRKRAKGSYASGSSIEDDAISVDLDKIALMTVTLLGANDKPLLPTVTIRIKGQESGELISPAQ